MWRWNKEVCEHRGGTRARAGWRGKTLDHSRSDTEMVTTCGEKDRQRCSNENMEDGSDWTSNDNDREAYVGQR